MQATTSAAPVPAPAAETSQHDEPNGHQHAPSHRASPRKGAHRGAADVGVDHDGEEEERDESRHAIPSPGTLLSTPRQEGKAAAASISSSSSSSKNKAKGKGKEPVDGDDRRVDEEDDETDEVDQPSAEEQQAADATHGNGLQHHRVDATSLYVGGQIERRSPSLFAGAQIEKSPDKMMERERKDNHKEVERRRRQAINHGINTLSDIVPGCNKSMFKGAIVASAVQYIQELKQNEASNIEKWTLEKLLMDQAVADLSSQLEHARRENNRLREILEGEGLNADAAHPAHGLPSREEQEQDQQEDDAVDGLEMGEESEEPHQHHPVGQHDDRRDSAEAAAAAAIAAASVGATAEEREDEAESDILLAAKRTAEHIDQGASSPNKRARQ